MVEADPASERLMLEMADFANNHNGGMLAFDSEGMLLVGTGDGGGGGDPEGNGQDTSQLLGKLLRIDVDGAVPYGVPTNDPAGLLGGGRSTRGSSRRGCATPGASASTGLPVTCSSGTSGKVHGKRWMSWPRGMVA